MPLTPPKTIPSFDELRSRSTSKAKSPAKGRPEDLLIDFSTPAPNREHLEVPVEGTEKVPAPFSPMRQVQTVDNEESDWHVEESKRDAELQRQAKKQAILDRRAERRKSMANRRVSFAPEATLHTWSVMEMAEDSTTSSASNSTRRQSSITAQQSPHLQPSSPAEIGDPTQRPGTPPDQIEEPQVVASPAHQRDLHKKQRRRSSTGPQAQLEGSIDETFSSSPSGDVRAESSPMRIDDSVGSSSDDDGDEVDNSMSVDESTSQSVLSGNSASITRSSLDGRLRLAASQAGTRGIDYDENGDEPMEMVTATVTRAFQPWAGSNQGAYADSAMQDQENVNPFSPAFKAQQTRQQSQIDDDETTQDDTQDMSMDVTNAIGGILAKASPSKSRRKSVANRRRSSVGRRQSSGEDSTAGDETMDFTTMGGGIVGKGLDEAGEDMSEADMTMEFTNAVGTVLGRESTLSVQSDENETMDMTAAVGGILQTIDEQTEPQTDAEDERTAAMEMTKAVGGILRSQATPQDKTRAKALMQEESDAGQLNLSPSSNKLPKAQTTPHAKTPGQGLVASIASETGSPDITLKPRLSGRSRQSTSAPSTTPKISPKRTTSVTSPMKITRAQSTPTKQLTPRLSKPETPNKTPVLANVVHRGASPKKLFKEEIKARASPASSRKPNAGLFARDENTGRHTPSVVLKATRPPAQRRRSSGVGIDQEGYGSPSVTQLLDRRTSIGDSAPSFQLDGTKKGLRFEDPKQIEREMDAERAEDERRESGRFVMEQEANEQQDENATQQLKDLIQSMTPKKDKTSKLKGRKSLAVGAAKGLLGKRPVELDSDEEDGDSTPKRLKIVERAGSPVKKVHLPKPPSKEETTGRLTGLQQKSLNSLNTQGNTTPALGSSPARKSVSSPQHGGRYRNVPNDKSAPRPESFEDKLDNVVGAIDVSTADEYMEKQTNEEQKISLQDFLNMTNVHFIELSTTKRRHTMVQATPKRASEEAAERSTESTFVAAATTLPLLELYQHATRELKSYISSGRKIIRSIETETLSEQPALFKEYIDARPDVKAVMDNQFRNGKTNARLQSKEGWYTWRAQLVEGLRTGLEGIKSGMKDDETLLTEQQETLNAVLPGLLDQKGSLQNELPSLQNTLEELDSIDTEALDTSRQTLKHTDEEHARKSSLLEQLRAEMIEKEAALSSAAELKEEMQGQIDEANRVKQEYRGWPVADVLALKVKVDANEKESGWRLAAAEEDEEDPNDFGVALTLMFRDELRLFFYPAIYQIRTGDAGRRRSGRRSRSVSGPTAPISLTYAPDTEHLATPPELPTYKRFFLQLIRSQLQAFSMMPKGSVTPKTVLDTVSKGWELATKLSEEIRLLNIAGITTTSIQGDDKLAIRVILVLSEKSRIDVEFMLSVTTLNDGDISSSTSVTAHGIYGQQAHLLGGSKSRKVQQALTKEAELKALGEGSLIGAIHGFEHWLASQKQSKPEQSKPRPQPVEEAVTVEAPVEPPPATKDIRRSPLAPKRTNAIQKKALPVPTTKHRTPAPSAHIPKAVVAEADKENAPPPPPLSSAAETKIQILSTPVKKSLETKADDWKTPETLTKPAIPPEMQEQWMAAGSPMKRVGALRRSPV